MKIQVTLVVVYHNEKENLQALLGSFEDMAGTGLESRFQFLFINNHSVDVSSGIIEGWMESHPQFVSRILNRRKNHMAEARQQALHEVRTPWLAFVDADSRLVSGWFEAVLKSIADASPETAVIGGKAHYLADRPWHSFVIPLAGYFPMGKKTNRKTKIPHIPTNNYLLKREAGLKVGGFDSFFDRVGEDMDINVRLRKKYGIFYDPRFSVEHKLPTSVFQWYSKMALYGRAQSFVFVKYFGEVPHEKFLPGILIPLILIMIGSVPWSFILLILLFFIPRPRLYLLSIIFYGLGEWVGLVMALTGCLKKSQFKSDV